MITWPPQSSNFWHIVLTASEKEHLERILEKDLEANTTYHDFWPSIGASSAKELDLRILELLKPPRRGPAMI